MKAVVYRGLRSVEWAEASEPRIEQADDALVEVELAAVCGSDLHVYQGREKGLDTGTVMGHEFAGRVVAKGNAVRRLRIGQRVASPFSSSCGRCFYCGEGLTARCEVGRLFGWVEEGVGLQGGQAERVRVPLADTTLMPLDEDLSFEQGVLLGDVLATGYHCARIAGAGPRGIFAVIGCGPVGLAAILAARDFGARDVFALDLVKERLALAERFGARPVTTLGEDALATLRAATGGRGADAVLEAVGSPESGRLAFDLVRPGGTIATVGVHHESSFPFSPAEAYEKNITFRTGRCPARGLMETLVPLARRLGAQLSEVITHRMPLSEGARAYEMFAGKQDGCIKIVLAP